jgi:hypothetical protein
MTFGRARHSVRAELGMRRCPRRARSDAPYLSEEERRIYAARRDQTHTNACVGFASALARREFRKGVRNGAPGRVNAAFHSGFQIGMRAGLGMRRRPRRARDCPPCLSLLGTARHSVRAVPFLKMFF